MLKSKILGFFACEERHRQHVHIKFGIKAYTVACQIWRRSARGYWNPQTLKFSQLTYAACSRQHIKVNFGEEQCTMVGTSLPSPSRILWICLKRLLIFLNSVKSEVMPESYNDLGEIYPGKLRHMYSLARQIVPYRQNGWVQEPLNFNIWSKLQVFGVFAP